MQIKEDHKARKLHRERLQKRRMWEVLNFKREFIIIHCYLSASQSDIRLDEKGYIEVRMKCGNWWAFEAKMREFNRSDLQLIWAVFDCDRVESNQ